MLLKFHQSIPCLAKRTIYCWLFHDTGLTQRDAEFFATVLEAVGLFVVYYLM
jgi:hypothetical protein